MCTYRSLAMLLDGGLGGRMASPKLDADRWPVAYIRMLLQVCIAVNE